MEDPGSKTPSWAALADYLKTTYQVNPSDDLCARAIEFLNTEQSNRALATSRASALLAIVEGRKITDYGRETEIYSLKQQIAGLEKELEGIRKLIK